jgi:DNA-binding CsgD family transcriptional regulator
MMSAVRGTRWVPLHLFTREDVDPRAREFRAYVDSDAEIPLAHMLAETDMVRRRVAVLVPPEMVGSRSYRPIIDVARSPAYVAAPILIRGRTVGFMHADRIGQPRLVDEVDRRLIQVFTAGLAVCYERAWSSEVLIERARRISGELVSTADALRRFESAPPGFTMRSAWSPVNRQPADAVEAPTRDFLTAREWEVLAHVADGATNRVIAHRLTVSEDTVKSHVHNVLRKLRVRTRAAAVARYLELSRGAR